MGAALVVAGKDLRQRMRDRSAVLIGIVAPLGLALILSSVLGGVTDGAPRFTFAVADEDRGEISRVFVKDVLGGLADEEVLTVVHGDPGEVERKVAAGDAHAAFVVPRGFSDAVLTGRPTTIEVLTDAGSPTAGGVARAVAGAFAGRLSADQLAVVTAVTAGAGSDVDALVSRVVLADLPLPLDTSTAPARQLDMTTYFSAGLAIFFLFFTVQFGVTSLLEERRTGTLPRLYASPIPRASVVAGKGIVSLVLGVVSMAVLVVATTLLLGASWGDPFGVAALVLAAVVAAVGIMAVVATFARTVDQANTSQSVVAVVLGFLGGAFFPVAQGPGLLADASMLTPHAWFLRGLGDLAAGGGVADVAGEVAAILVFALVALTVAALRRDTLTAP